MSIPDSSWRIYEEQRELQLDCALVSQIPSSFLTSLPLFHHKSPKNKFVKDRNPLREWKGGGEAKQAEIHSSGKGMANDCESKY